jgi:NADPH:quinone reductase-like Zn-dependent oxidoreductase
VIDYSREDFTQRPEWYDVVFDAVASSSFPACRHLLKAGGAYVTILPGPGILFWAAVQSIPGLFGRAKRAKFFMVEPEGSDLSFLGQLADQGRLRPALAPTYPLEEAHEAQDESERGHVRGKIVLAVGS